MSYTRLAFAWAFLALLPFPPAFSYVHYYNYTELCDVKLNLSSPTECVKINFNIPPEIASRVPRNCTCHIDWIGDETFSIWASATFLPGFVGSDHEILHIERHRKKRIDVSMMEPRAYYLTITPLKDISQQSAKPCPSSYVSCAGVGCLHRVLSCDGVKQCPYDEQSCAKQTKSPSNTTLLMQIFAVPALFLSLSGLIALVGYFTLFREPSQGLAKKSKQMFYGTVNASFESQSSLSSSECETSRHFYHENLNSEFARAPLITSVLKK